MKIAVHHRKGSFSSHWIEYFQNNNIPYKIVNCYDNDIISQISDCDALMWHYFHGDYRDVLFAKELLFSIQLSGKKVFPDINTCWHFDDKVAQKYLLEAADAPLIPSYVFYEREIALQWAQMAVYPKVFKLRNGAGATNVRLISNYKDCERVINKAFSSGFYRYNVSAAFKDAILNYRLGTGRLKNIFGELWRVFKPTKFVKMTSKEKGYVYFQDFVPGNSFDIRLIVISKRYAYGLRRLNRKGDFRASGSSIFAYDKIPLEAVQVAFSTAKKLNLQSVAFDFVLDPIRGPLIIEMSFGFGTKGSSKCPGFWTSDLKWHECDFNPFQWMVSSLIDPHE